MLTPLSLTLGNVSPQRAVYSRLATQLDHQVAPGLSLHQIYQTIWAAVCGESSTHIYREMSDPIRLSS